MGLRHRDLCEDVLLFAFVLYAPFAEDFVEGHCFIFAAFEALLSAEIRPVSFLICRQRVVE